MTDQKADAWMPLWIGAYMADTMTFTTAQHGAYLLLLMAYWRERVALPDDDEQLRAITRSSKAEWVKLRPVLARKFKVDAGVWWHKRVESEIAAAEARAKKAAEKAKKAASARWKHGDEHPTSNATSIPQAMHEECPTPSPTPSLSESSEAKASGAADAPPAVDKSKNPEEMAKAELWRTAVAVLLEGGCTSEPVCRTFMGKLVADYTIPVVREAVAAAATEQPADARAYLKAACQRIAGERNQRANSITVPSAAADQTAEYLAEQARIAAQSKTPESEAARKAAMQRIHGPRAAA